MRTPTGEQATVLGNEARIRVVRAAPGSGKTWLVAEIIRRELAQWPNRTSGVAALSFTRIGGHEIRAALGHDLTHPHFVGTIDAFLLRYVLRPFLSSCFPGITAPRMVPGDWGADQWKWYGNNKKVTVGKNINTFGCVFIGEDGNKPLLAHKPYPGQGLQKLEGSELELALKAKKEMWKGAGLLTHSDAAYLAWKVVEHATYGPVIRRELCRRFPFIVVDELQDTGIFLGKSIREILKDVAARGVLVGDPDQAIYEFTGARPDLFDQFETLEGAQTIPLSESRRCAPAIAAAATHLKDLGGAIGPAQSRKGRAVLLEYRDMVADVTQVVEAVLTTEAEGTVKVVARQTTTIDTLLGRKGKAAPKLQCPTLNHIQRGVIHFRQGRQARALAASRAAVDLAVFGSEGVTDDRLAASGIDSNEWARLSIRCLMRCNQIPTSGTQYKWQVGAGRVLDEELLRMKLNPQLAFAAGTLKPRKREGWDTPSSDVVPTAEANTFTLSTVPVQTVHGVKGETHDITIFVYPPTKANTCPSDLWWSDDDKAREERRIAYVAMTRSQGDLIVCVSTKTFTRLNEKRPEFVDAFEVMTVGDFLESRTHSVQVNVAHRPR